MLLSVLCLLSVAFRVSAASAQNGQLALLVAASASGAAVGYKSADDFCIKSKPGKIGLALGTGFLTGMTGLIVAERKGYYIPAVVGAVAVAKMAIKHPNHVRPALVGGITALSASMLISQYVLPELAPSRLSGVCAIAGITLLASAGASEGVCRAAHKAMSVSKSTSAFDVIDATKK